jgi:hypothetical protein
LQQLVEKHIDDQKKAGATPVTIGKRNTKASLAMA